jgi:hypothetical protein
MKPPNPDNPGEITTAEQAKCEAKRRWGTLGAVNDQSIPADDNGDAINWMQVGIIYFGKDDEGRNRREFEAYGEGDSLEAAFEDAEQNGHK